MVLELEVSGHGSNHVKSKGTLKLQVGLVAFISSKEHTDSIRILFVNSVFTIVKLHKFELDTSDRSRVFGRFAQAPAQSSATSGADAAPQDVLTSPHPSLHPSHQCSECSAAGWMAISKPYAGAWPVPWPMHCRATCTTIHLG